MNNNFIVNNGTYTNTHDAVHDEASDGYYCAHEAAASSLTAPHVFVLNIMKTNGIWSVDNLQDSTPWTRLYPNRKARCVLQEWLINGKLKIFALV